MTITAKIIKDSVNPWGKRITTFELEYPRLIHSELMTHRVFSRNAASSRAIPVDKMIQQVKDNPAMPFKWGKNRPGMQASENLTPEQEEAAKQVWLASRDQAVSHATILSQMGLHKQVVNRVLEPYQHIKVVLTTTEYVNWKWLRKHDDADPTIHELARVLDEARDDSVPTELDQGMWHLPYVNTEILSGIQHYFDENENEISLEDALKICCSSCAQVSYRKLDTSLEKAEDLYKRLVESEPVHASAFEHAAMVVKRAGIIQETMKGVTAIRVIIGAGGYPEVTDDLPEAICSGNFVGGWIQYRQLIPNNAKQG